MTTSPAARGIGEGPDLSRLVQIRSRGKRGTGFLVADDLVVTAAHVVSVASAADELGVEVRLFDASGPQTVPWVHAQVIQTGAASKTLDVALLRIDPTNSIPVPDTSAPVWGRIIGTASIPVFAVCFPKVMKGSSGPDSHVIRGVVEPAQGATRFAAGEATLAIVDGSIVPARGLDENSPWSGASGAAVFAAHGGQLIGVITDDFNIAPIASVLTFSLVAKVDGLARQAGIPVVPVAPNSATVELVQAATTVKASNLGLFRGRSRRLAAVLVTSAVAATAMVVAIAGVLLARNNRDLGGGQPLETVTSGNSIATRPPAVASTATQFDVPANPASHLSLNDIPSPCDAVTQNVLTEFGLRSGAAGVLDTQLPNSITIPTRGCTWGATKITGNAIVMLYLALPGTGPSLTGNAVAVQGVTGYSRLDSRACILEFYRSSDFIVTVAVEPEDRGTPKQSDCDGAVSFADAVYSNLPNG